MAFQAAASSPYAAQPLSNYNGTGPSPTPSALGISMQNAPLNATPYAAVANMANNNGTGPNPMPEDILRGVQGAPIPVAVFQTGSMGYPIG